MKLSAAQREACEFIDKAKETLDEAVDNGLDARLLRKTRARKSARR